MQRGDPGGAMKFQDVEILASVPFIDLVGVVLTQTNSESRFEVTRGSC